MRHLENRAYYHLAVEEEAAEYIDLHLHPDSLETVQDTISEQNQRYLADVDFVADKDSWGYGGIAQVVDSSSVDGWQAIRYPIPNVDLCKEAETGMLGMTYKVFSREELLPLSTSLVMPLYYLNKGIKGEEPMKSSLISARKTPQYLTAHLDTRPEPGHYSAGMYATVKPDLVRWLRKNAAQPLETAIIQVMFKVYSRLRLTDIDNAGIYDPLLRYRVDIRSARDVHFDIPGDGTGLDSFEKTSHREDEKSNDEYRLIPHNTDMLEGQLALLAGVAFLAQSALKNVEFKV